MRFLFSEGGSSGTGKFCASFGTMMKVAVVLVGLIGNSNS